MQKLTLLPTAQSEGEESEDSDIEEDTKSLTDNIKFLPGNIKSLQAKPKIYRVS